MASAGNSVAKFCFNSACNEEVLELGRGWKCRTGDFADLCDRCAYAYYDGKFCETFHLDAPNWSLCKTCGKQIHCGCIAAEHLYVLLDAGGIECLCCARNSFILTPNPTWAIPSPEVSRLNAIRRTPPSLGKISNNHHRIDSSTASPSHQGVELGNFGDGIYEEMNVLSISWQQAQGLLRSPPGIAPTVETVEGCEFMEYQEAPIIERPTIGATENDRSQCSAAEDLTPEQLQRLLPQGSRVQEGNACALSSVGSKKHPRHRPGCRCAVCKQRPRSSREQRPSVTEAEIARLECQVPPSMAMPNWNGDLMNLGPTNEISGSVCSSKKRAAISTSRSNGQPLKLRSVQRLPDGNGEAEAEDVQAPPVTQGPSMSTSRAIHPFDLNMLPDDEE